MTMSMQMSTAGWRPLPMPSAPRSVALAIGLVLSLGLCSPLPISRTSIAEAAGAVPPWVAGVDGFEGSDFWAWWSVDNGTWEWGIPTSGPGAAHEGSKVVATRLADNYLDDTWGRLVSAPFVVPAADAMPRLRLWHWFEFSCGDFGQVQIRVGAGDWTPLATYRGYSGGTWSREWLDVSSYAGQTVELGFYFESHNDSCNRNPYTGSNPVDTAPGWYIDELTVVTGPLPTLTANALESFEAPGFWDGWSADRGTWEWGSPTSGPGAAHDGRSVVATILAGTYGDDTTSRLVSPAFVVPAADQNPRLRLWQWFQFSCGDSGQVQIKPAAGDWTPLATYTGYSGGVWGREWLDLSGYGGQTVELGFYFESHNDSCNRNPYTGSNPVDTAPGWYIDELTVVTGPLPTLTANALESFEAPGFWDGWSAGRGTWEWGSPTSGPGAAHDGSNVAATVLGGSYGDDTSSRLVGPRVVVPAADENPRVRFWHWFSFSCGDSGQIQIKAGSGDWTSLATFSGTSGGTWTYPSLQLSDYAGQTVELGLYFESHNDPCNRNPYTGDNPVDTAAGWYVDEICICSGACTQCIPSPTSTSTTTSSSSTITTTTTTSSTTSTTSTTRTTTSTTRTTTSSTTSTTSTTRTTTTTSSTFSTSTSTTTTVPPTTTSSTVPGPCPGLAGGTVPAFAGGRVRVPVNLVPNGAAVAALNYRAEWTASLPRVTGVECTAGSATTSVSAQHQCVVDAAAGTATVIIVDSGAQPVRALPPGTVTKLLFGVAQGTAGQTIDVCIPRESIVFGDTTGREIACVAPPTCGQVQIDPRCNAQGDCNCDGVVNSGDRVCLISKFFDPSLQGTCGCEDCNLSGSLNSADAPCITQCAFQHCPPTGD